jgi:RAB protein geranylgeranyltransferase component A
VGLARLPRDSAGTYLMVQACRDFVLINRACAVFGGTYVLGKESVPETMEIEEGTEYPVKLKIPCHPRTISAKHLISSPDHLPQQLQRSAAGNKDRQTAHCIALLPALPTQLRRQEKDKTDGGGTDGDEDEEGQDDTAVIVFPPSGDQGLVRALVMGEGTGSCPAGQCKCN